MMDAPIVKVIFDSAAEDGQAWDEVKQMIFSSETDARKGDHNEMTHTNTCRGSWFTTPTAAAPKTSQWAVNPMPSGPVAILTKTSEKAPQKVAAGVKYAAEGAVRPVAHRSVTSMFERFLHRHVLRRRRVVYT
eukprot:TRINITY_DN123469_c0_g1_i1.p2 TRINITY_DN123469_c0_g1~~TRINITY_DN123469_c0_g1_i1.p2  ORF type:complete len:133 (+),score=20.01 TRINITY_DN123469_c0_g1_i1:35-433(+)